MLFRLLRNGRRVELVNGRILIYKPSGELVDPREYKSHIFAIAKELCSLLSFDVYQLRPKHRTGLFGGHKGVLCQFERMKDGEKMYAIFNADLTYQRNTTYHKQGDALPYGLGKRFDLPFRSPLLKLCRQVGILNKPTEIYKSIGKLSIVFCSAKEHPEKPRKLISSSFKPVSIPYETIIKEFQRAYSTSSLLNFTNNSPATFDKGVAKDRVIHESQSKQNTCDKNYVYKDTRNRDIPLSLYKYRNTQLAESERVKLQSNDEWLSELGPITESKHRDN